MMKNNLTYKATVKDLKTHEEKELVFSGITLLSVEEYKKNEDIIPLIDNWWWLRSPGGYSDCAAGVSSYGYVGDCGVFVDIGDSAVRPALILNQKSRNLFKAGNKIEIVGKTWTVLEDGLVLCNESIGKHCFREDYKAPDANDFEKSDIKALLNHWMDEKFEKENVTFVTIEKIVIQKTGLNVALEGIDLLSVDEFKGNETLISNIDAWWWLRTNEDSVGTAYVDFGNHSFVDDKHVDCKFAIRPVLSLSDNSKYLLSPGDKFEIANYTWTVLYDGLALCDSIIMLQQGAKIAKTFLNEWGRINLGINLRGIGTEK